MNQIQYLNSMRKHKDSAYYGVTKYSDLSKEEFLKLRMYAIVVVYMV